MTEGLRKQKHELVYKAIVNGNQQKNKLSFLIFQLCTLLL